MKFNPENVKLRLEQRGLVVSDEMHDFMFKFLDFTLTNISKLFTEEEKDLLFEWINDTSVDDVAFGSIYVIAVINCKHFESHPEFQGMSIDTYNKKMKELKRNADELSKYSETPITVKFPIHPNTIAAEFKTSLDSRNSSKQDKERYWDAFKSFTGISQIRKTKANSFIFDNHIVAGQKEKIAYYSYTTTK